MALLQLRPSSAPAELAESISLTIEVDGELNEPLLSLRSEDLKPMPGRLVEISLRDDGWQLSVDGRSATSGEFVLLPGDHVTWRAGAPSQGVRFKKAEAEAALDFADPPPVTTTDIDGVELLASIESTQDGQVLAVATVKNNAGSLEFASSDNSPLEGTIRFIDSVARLDLLGHTFLIPRNVTNVDIACGVRHGADSSVRELLSGDIAILLGDPSGEILPLVAVGGPDWPQWSQQLWPPGTVAPAGKITALRIGPGGLHLETETEADVKSIRRLSLISADGANGVLTWEHLALPDQPHLEQPQSRLGAVRDRLANVDATGPEGARLLRVVEASRDASAGRVLFQVRTGDGSELVEIHQPNWALAVQGAVFQPRYVRVDKTSLRLSDRLVYGAEDSLEVTWTGANEPEPQFSKMPDLHSTGATLGGAENLPYVWQFTALAGPGDKRHPGIWVRYKVDQRPWQTPPLRGDAPEFVIQSANNNSQAWLLRVRPTADDGVIDGATEDPSRIDLMITTEENHRTQLTSLRLAVSRPHIVAYSPIVRALRDKLLDPESLPNVQVPSEALEDARIEFASDVLVLDGDAARLAGRHSHLRTRVENNRFVINAVSTETTIAVAFLPTPLAGIDPISWTGNNRVSKLSLEDTSIDPEAAPPVVRDYNQGIVPVELRRITNLTATELTVAEDADVVLPKDVTAMKARLPVAEMRLAQDGTFTVDAYHRSLALEQQEFALTDQATAKRTVDAESPIPRSVREQDYRDAMRDRAAYAAQGLLAGSDGQTRPVLHWLPSLQDQNGISVTPELSLGIAPSVDVGTKYSLEARIGTDPQSLAPIAPDESAAPWLETFVRWPAGMVATDGRTRLEIADDLRRGAFHVANGTAPVLFQYADIVAIAAQFLGHQLVVFCADTQNELFAWRPFSQPGTDNPQRLTDKLTLPAGNITALALRTKGSFGALIVGWSDGRIDRFDVAGEGGDLALTMLAPPIDQSGAITNVLITARVPLAPLNKSLVVFSTDEGAVRSFEFGVNPPDIKSLPRQSTAPVTALHFRRLDTEGQTLENGEAAKRQWYLALATANNVLVYQWDGTFNFESPQRASRSAVDPDDSVNPLPDLVLPSEEQAITSVQIHPYWERLATSLDGAKPFQDILHVFAGTAPADGQNDQAGEVVRWKIENDNRKSDEATSERLVPPQATANRADPAAGTMRAAVTGLSLESGETLDNSQYLAAVTTGDADGIPELSVWEARWPGDVAGGRLQRAGFAQGSGHIGEITAVEVISGRGSQYVVTAGRDGTVRVWRPDAADEVRRLDPISGDRQRLESRSTRYCDNLQVVRQMHGTKPLAEWQVEQVLVGNKPVLSLSTLGAVQLAVDSANRTDISFCCSELKLEFDEGGWRLLDRAKPDLHLGVASFFGSDKSDETTQSWPRLNTVPIYVTKLVRIEFPGATTVASVPEEAPSKIVLEAVLANPARIQATNDGQSPPPFVSEAVARQAVLHLELVRDADASTFDPRLQEDSKFLWRFDLANQIPVEFSAATFPGQLALLAGTVTLEAGRLRLTPSAPECRAAAFGRLWPLQDVPKLIVDPLVFAGDGDQQTPVRLKEDFQDGGKGPFLRRRELLRPASEIKSVSLQLVPDSLQALTAGNTEEHHGVAVLSDAESGDPVRTYEQRHRRAVFAPYTSGSGSKLELFAALADVDGVARIWNLQTLDSNSTVPEAALLENPRHWSSIGLPNEILSMDARQVGDRHFLLFRCGDGTARLWDREEGIELHTFALPNATVTAAVLGPAIESVPGYWNDFISPDRRPEDNSFVVALGGSDGSVRVYFGKFAPGAEESEPLAIREFRQFFDHTRPISSLSLEMGKSARLFKSGEGQRDGLLLLSCQQSPDSFDMEITSPPVLREVITGDIEEPLRIPSNMGDVTAGKIVRVDDTKVLMYLAMKTETQTELRYLLKISAGRQNQVRPSETSETSEFPIPKPRLIKAGNDSATLDVVDFDVVAVEDNQTVAMTLRDRMDNSSIVLRRFSPGETTDISEDQVDGVAFSAASSVSIIEAKYRESDAEKRMHLILASDAESGRVVVWVRRADPPERWEMVTTLNQPVETALNPVTELNSATLGEVPAALLLRADHNQLDVWDPQFGVLSTTPIKRSLQNAPRALAHIQGELHLAVADGEVVRLWNQATEEMVAEFLHSANVVDLDLATVGTQSWLLTCADNNLQLWDTATRQPTPLQPESSGARPTLARFAHSKDGLAVLVGMSDGSIAFSTDFASSPTWIRVPDNNSDLAGSFRSLEIATVAGDEYILAVVEASAILNKAFLIHLGSNPPNVSRLGDNDTKVQTAAFARPPHAIRAALDDDPIVVTLASDSENGKWILHAWDVSDQTRLQEYELLLITDDDIPGAGNKVVIVARVEEAEEDVDVDVEDEDDEEDEDEDEDDDSSDGTGHTLHFCIFDENGNKVVDKSEAQVKEEDDDASSEAIVALKEKLKSLRDGDELTPRRKHDIISRVTSLVGSAHYYEVQIEPRNNPAPAAMAVVRHDGGQRVIAASASGTLLVDLGTKQIVRRYDTGHSTLHWTNLPSVFTAGLNGEFRAWDRASGRLLVEEQIGLTGDLRSIAAVQLQGQPLLIAGLNNSSESGSASVLVRNLWTASSQTTLLTDATDVRQVATAVVAGNCGIAAATTDKGLFFVRTSLAEFDTPTSTRLEGDESVLKAAVAAHAPDHFLVAATTESLAQVWRFNSESEPKDNDLFLVGPLDHSAASIALDRSFDSDAVLLAVGDIDGHVSLWDGREKSPTPRTADWQFDGAGGTSYQVDITWTPDGPRLLAATQNSEEQHKRPVVLTPLNLLRIGGRADLLFQLPIQFNEGESAELLSGVITTGRKLDLQLDLNTVFGERDLFHARPAIIQNLYHGLLLENPVRLNRKRGAMVVWQEGSLRDATLKGLILLEDHETASANIKFDSTSVKLEGLRSRLRVHCFDLSQQGSSSLVKQVISWHLHGNDAQSPLELLINEQVLSGRTGHLIAFFKQLLPDSESTVHGHLVLDAGLDTGDYTFTVPESTFYLQPVRGVAQLVESLRSGVARDDIVLPAPAADDGRIGESFNLVGVVRDHATLAGEALAARSVGRFVRLQELSEEEGIKLAEVQQEVVPLNLEHSTEVLRPLDKLPLATPQLVHRLVRGTRLRGQVPEGAKLLELSANDHIGQDRFDWQQENSVTWLASPLLLTDRGVRAIYEPSILLERRILRHERLRTEGLLNIFRNVDRRVQPSFGIRPGRGAEAVDSIAVVENVLTVSAKLGAGAADNVLLNQRHIRDHIVQTGTTGVILHRQLASDGQVRYQFVSSPFYSHDVVVTHPVDQNVEAPADTAELSTVLDPRLLPPDEGRRLAFNAQLRYVPTRCRPDAASDPADQAQIAAGRGLRYEWAGERGTPTNESALQVAEQTAFEYRKPLWSPPPTRGHVTGTFLPDVFEIRHGIDKPGAMIHHTLRAVNAGNGGNEALAIEGPLVDLARREPLVLAPPPGAKLILDLLQRRGQELTISWRETLGSVELRSDLMGDLVSAITSEGNTFRLKEPDQVLQMVQRIDENIVPIRKSDPFVFLPATRRMGAEGATGTVDQTPELYLITKFNLLEGVRLDGDELRPYLVRIDDPGIASVALAEIFEETKAGRGSEFSVWKATPAIKDYFSIEATLDIVWATQPPDQTTLESAARLFAEQPKQVRRVFISPSRPQVAAVLELGEGDQTQTFFGTLKERTLFYGDAATVGGVLPAIEGSEAGVNGQVAKRLVFHASARETVTLRSKLEASAFVSVYKYLGDGPTIYDVRKLTIS